MSRLAHRLRSRWPIAALLAGGFAATLLALVPSRAEALDAPGYCAATGIFFCFRPEIGVNDSGFFEVRMFYAGPHAGSWGF